MRRNPLQFVVGFVTDHSRITIAVMLLLTVVAGAGATMIEAPPDQQLASDAPAQEKLDYISEQYDTGDSDVETVSVYVRDTDGNVLSKGALVDVLEYEQRIASNASVARSLADGRGTTSVAGLVGARLAGDPSASAERRLTALRSADATEVRSAVRATLASDSDGLSLMPASYEPRTASAESTRVVVHFAADARSDAGTEPEAVLHRAALSESDGGDREYFMLTGPATEDFGKRTVVDNLELIGPLALLLILLTLAFAYRDLPDLLVGMTGVLLTLVWMFGLIGWLGVPFGSAGIVAPILLIGLSIDYGIHVFMRYREERAASPDLGVRSSMRRGLRGVGVALALVTLTTAIGFLANLTNSLGSIRQLTLATALGVVAALIVFVTIVPALKVELDALLDRLLGDRNIPPIGAAGGRLTRFLTAGVTAARISAVGVVLVAVVAGASGAYASTELDRELGTYPDEPADWKQDLPDPVGIEEYPFLERNSYVRSNYRATGADYSPAQILVEGEVTDPETLERIDTATARLSDSEAAYRRADGSVPIRTPLTVMDRVAARDDSFASVYRAADTNGDGVPDRHLERVYDALFGSAPDQASTVVERDQDGYRSVRVVVPMRQSSDDRDVAATMYGGAEPIDEAADLSATATGDSVIREVQGDRLTSNIFATLVVSLVAIVALLAGIYRLTEGRASLGVVTVLPVALVVTWVLAGMWLLSVPLTMFTALMISLAIGLGVDYSIHVTERFAQEFGAVADPFQALETTVVGTGGALLGSTGTTVGAFATLSLATFPGLRQMGLMVGLALLLSFVASVFVLPSLLVLWARAVGLDAGTAASRATGAAEGTD
ncbi:efflux RND transporter permease subunit [Haloarchaeobius iranensis]|uniref:Predicted exporter protein, RND superfamily n=1 Tax=Haloarchaeobius iranensis TaxID=996166 RepID=A0A1G9ZB89_9EURY|nr:MMPL family transporter [Haloarchaeobius iranensis]SDN18662.1 Predicted exporter protein, RND superfamily [Haloarchaeobius iranensis]